MSLKGKINIYRVSDGLEYRYTYKLYTINYLLKEKTTMSCGIIGVCDVN